jgi:predicted ATPase
MAVQDLYLLTGAPGTGKTAILAELAPGIRCFAEPARGILAEQRSIGGVGTPDRDPTSFVDLLLRRSIDDHEAARGWEGPTVFDRGVPDCIAYARWLGVDPTPSLVASERYRYSREAMLLEPWEDIYTTDDERTMSFADIVEFHAVLTDAYERAGYALVEVSRGSVEIRAAFVRSVIARRG